MPNFFAAAISLDVGSAPRAATRSLAVVLGGFLLRMVSILVVILVARALFGWVRLRRPRRDAVRRSHLGLLSWELRSVSFSLASPGLKRDRLTTSDERKTRSDAARIDFPPITHVTQWPDIFFKDTPFGINKTVLI